MASSAESQEKPAATRIIAMLNQKGGVGKTTSAVNLGAALAHAGQRVCLIDLDPQAHLTLHLGVDGSEGDRTVYDLLIDPECGAEEVLITEARPNLDAILAEVDLAGAESELSSTEDRHSVLRRKFEPILGNYDVVIIDCPPSLGLLTLNALTVATEIFVPMQAHFLALQGVGRLLETVGLVCRNVNPSFRVTGIILCMHEAQTTLAKEVVADLDAFFASAREQEVPWRDCRVLRPPVRRNIKLAEAPSFGQTIFDYSPWCAGALDYRKLAKNLIKDWAAPGSAPGSVVGNVSGGVPKKARDDAPEKVAEAVSDDGKTAMVEAEIVEEEAPVPAATITNNEVGKSVYEVEPTARDEVAKESPIDESHEDPEIVIVSQRQRETEPIALTPTETDAETRSDIDDRKDG